jgi:hypothetical protein
MKHYTQAPHGVLLDDDIIVTVPGNLHAHYDRDTGKISGWVFLPHGGDAGYFGPAAELWDGDDLDDDFIDRLDVRDTKGGDGLFWEAVGYALNPDGKFTVQWEG